MAREADVGAERVLVGDVLSIRDRREISSRALGGVYPGPNAPLLIRLVRYPFALDPVRAERSETGSRGIAAGAKRERLEPVPQLMQLAREARGVLLPGNPLRTELAFEPPARLKHPMLFRALSVPRTAAADPLEIKAPWRRGRR